MTPFQQSPVETDQGLAIGWISTAELFLLVE